MNKADGLSVYAPLPEHILHGDAITIIVWIVEHLFCLSSMWRATRDRHVHYTRSRIPKIEYRLQNQYTHLFR